MRYSQAVLLWTAHTPYKAAGILSIKRCGSIVLSCHDPLPDHSIASLIIANDSHC
jgi:hypothetical protein